MTTLCLHQAAVGRGINDYRLLKQSIEELSTVPRTAPVETESEFIEVISQMVSGNSTLMDTQKPPFQQGGNAVNPGHEGRGFLYAGSNHARPVDITEIAEAHIGRPPVRDDHGPRNHRFFNEAEQTRSGSVWDPPEPYAADSSTAFGFHSYDHQCLCFSKFSSPFPPFDTSDDDFIHLCLSPQTIPAWADHSPPQFMKTGPCRSVASETQCPLEPCRTDTAFLVGDSPHRTEPNTQWDMASVKDGPRCYGDISSTSTATKEPYSHLPRLFVTATRTAKSITPPYAGQVGPTGLLCGEPPLKLHRGLGIVLRHVESFYLRRQGESSA